jgi:DNA repair protein RadD
MTLILRPYQRHAIDGINQYFHANSGNPLCVIPTAGGKSLIIATFIREAIEAWPGTRILVVTHVRELIAQNYAEMMGLWPEAPAGIHSAGLNRRDVRSQIIFGGIQSLESRAHLLGRVDLILVDECHLMPRDAGTRYQSFITALRAGNPYIKVIGFTATPFRMDSGYLHKGPDALFSDIAYEARIRDLINDGYLCQPISKVAVEQIDTSNVGTRGGEFIPGQLEAAAIDPETVTAVANEIVANSEGREGILVFGCGVDHAIKMRDALRERGISCESIFGDTPHHLRDSIIRRFKEKKIRALSSMGVLTTGFNARHVDMIALARPTKSTGLYIQIVGRGTRLYEGKENFLVLDFGGNIGRHGPIDQPQVRASERECPACGTPNRLSAKECIKCGAEFEREIPFKICEACGTENPLAARICVNPDCGEPFSEPKSVLTTKPSTKPILSSTPPPEWIPVSSVSYRRHIKPGKPDSMCVTYRCGLSAHREWVCFQHEGYAREKAAQWWRARAPAVPIPMTVTEALDNTAALTPAHRILVRLNGRYTEIVGVGF